MGYIVKFTDSNTYLIPDNDDWMTTTASKELAIEIGQSDDKETAELTAHSFSGGMTVGIDFILEEV
ncbi:hypothetical protein [Acinetobacter courvalinii]|uniref:Uncharacterized protein n=1 Tax=Acinetobacter courvalinii TaxID=280147 RepID=A0AA42LER7_9GAMM|nr:hypothetical protein [Acinetobacter courvalinii]MDH0563782.1 hypothetical protein [Acinetobacter courvalinii]